MHWRGSARLDCYTRSAPFARLLSQIITCALNVFPEPMTSDQMVSVSLTWQLEHVEKGPDVFAGPPYCDGEAPNSVQSQQEPDTKTCVVFGLSVHNVGKFSWVSGGLGPALLRSTRNNPSARRERFQVHFFREWKLYCAPLVRCPFAVACRVQTNSAVKHVVYYIHRLLTFVVFLSNFCSGIVSSVILTFFCGFLSAVFAQNINCFMNWDVWLLLCHGCGAQTEQK